MKKSLYFLTLMLVFALIFCSCAKNEQGAAQTTGESTDAVTETVTENINTDAQSSDTVAEDTESAAESQSDVESSVVESSTDVTDEATESESEVETEDETTEPQTTKPAIEPLVFNFNDVTAKVLKAQFSEAAQTSYAVETDEDGQQHTVQTLAQTGIDAVDGQQLGTFLDVVGHSVQHSVGGNVGEGVNRIPQQVGNTEPNQLAGFTECAGDGEQGDGHNGDQRHGDPQPGQTFLTVLKLHLVEDETENGVVDGVPNLDDQQHDGYLCQGNSLHCQVGGDKRGGDVIVDILSHKIGPVA